MFGASRLVGARTLGRSGLLTVAVGGTAFAGGATFAAQQTKCQAIIANGSNEIENKSVFVPTLEATIRAIRLVRTAGLIIADYELSKLKLFTDGGQEEAELNRLEQEMASFEAELEGAQMEYASETDKSVPVSVEERRTLKRRQKNRMEDAAARLAEAEEALSSMEGESNKSKVHKKAANRLLGLCRDNGGVYIKVGQHLANLDYLIPQEYIEVLSSLFDDAPESSYSDVCRVIEEELGGNVKELFDDFEPVPIASASLAQVHVAYDKKKGKKLAVKVQHAGLRETSAGDIFAVTCVVRLVDSIFKEFTFGWIADEIAPHLPKELDFLREGKNAERAEEHLQGTGLNCIVPKVIWEKSAPRVLTMEFEEGFKSTDVEALGNSGLSRFDVAKLISSVFNSQVFLSSFVHCDPHAGNILIRNKDGKPQMVLLDHGLYKEIDDKFRIKYAQLWKSLMLADLKGIEESCHAMGINKAYPLFAAMLTARPYDEIIERSKTGSFSASAAAPDSQADRAVIRGYAKQFLSEIFVLLGILPRQMLLLLKMNDCLRHIDFALKSPTNTLVVAGKYASQAVYENEIKEKVSRRSRILSWLSYMKVLTRIHIHDFGAWILQKRSTALMHSKTPRD